MAACIELHMIQGLTCETLTVKTFACLTTKVWTSQENRLDVDSPVGYNGLYSWTIPSKVMLSLHGMYTWHLVSKFEPRCDIQVERDVIELYMVQKIEIQCVGYTKVGLLVTQEKSVLQLSLSRKESLTSKTIILLDREYLEGCDALDSDCSLVFGAGCGKHSSLAMDQRCKQPNALLQAQHKRTVTHWRL